MDDRVRERLSNGELREVLNVDLLAAREIEGGHVLAGLNEAHDLIEGEEQWRIEPLDAPRLSTLGLPILIEDRRLRTSSWGTEQNLPRLRELLLPIDYAKRP